MRFALLLFALFSLAACSTTQSTSAPSSQDVIAKDAANGQDLTFYLKRLTGVQVRGSGPDAQIIIRGTSTFNAATGPLFVLNGQVLGHDYSQIYGAIDINSVDDIRVLKNAGDLAAYGSRGANGVIEVFTK